MLDWLTGSQAQLMQALDPYPVLPAHSAPWLTAADPARAWDVRWQLTAVSGQSSTAAAWDVLLTMVAFACDQIAPLRGFSRPLVMQAREQEIEGARYFTAAVVTVCRFST